MISEPLTLYKLMILYMLKAVNFPLTNSQLSGFFLDYEYTTYFTFQQVINELLEAGLISAHASRQSTRYEITPEGEETLGFFGSDIASGAIKDMDDFLKLNKFRLRSESASFSDFYEVSNGNYVVHVEVREGKSILIGMDINVPDKESAEFMCSRWNEKNAKIYAYVIKQLLG